MYIMHAPYIFFINYSQINFTLPPNIYVEFATKTDLQSFIIQSCRKSAHIYNSTFQLT